MVCFMKILSLNNLIFYDKKIKEYIKSSLSNNVIDSVYPVGSIYISVSNNSPSTLFGGTWKQIKDTFLLAAGASYNAGTTGGSSSFKLTKAQTPFYTTEEEAKDYGVAQNTGFKNRMIVERPSKTSASVIDNMPPYLTVYMWERTG